MTALRIAKLSVSGALLNCPLQELFDVIYLNASTCREYHAKENDDPHAEVGPWVDGERLVCFNAPLRAPAVVKRTLGLEALRVREQSRAEHHADGSITITSHPVVDSLGGDRFKSTAVTRIEPQPEGGCQVRSCCASVSQCRDTMA